METQWRLVADVPCDGTPLKYINHEAIGDVYMIPFLFVTAVGGVRVAAALGPAPPMPPYCRPGKAPRQIAAAFLCRVLLPSDIPRRSLPLPPTPTPTLLLRMRPGC